MRVAAAVLHRWPGGAISVGCGCFGWAIHLSDTLRHMPHSRLTRWPLHAVAIGCVCVAFTALRGAVSWYGAPVAEVFLDPSGVVSNIGLTRRPRQSLGFPDVVLAVDGQRLVGGMGDARARVWDESIRRAHRAGRDSVEAVILSGRQARVVRLGISRLQPREWWAYPALSIFAGILFALTGLLALWGSPRSPLARAFAKLNLSSGALIALVFDFHTARTLAPLFLVAFASVPVSCVMLALRLPDDAPILRRAPWLERVLDGLALLVASTFVATYWLRGETQVLQRLWSAVFAVSLVSFIAVFVWRFVASRGPRREQLRLLLLSGVPPHLLTAAIVFNAARSDGGNAILYGSLSFFPLATAYAVIRYNLWATRTLLSRLLTRALVAGIACAIAVAVGTAAAVQLGVPFRNALLAVGLGAVLAPALVLGALRAVDRFIFASRVKYKPTVEQLSEELITIASPQDVAVAMERTIRRWLPCEMVELSLASAQSSDSDLLLDPGQSGIATRVVSSPAQLTLPIEFAGVRLGGLRVGAKAGAALFTGDDVDLLRTIVNQGALALAHANAYQELEVRRREQAAAFRGERAALVETMAAEIAHEIRYPINFFRSVFEQSAKGRPLDAEDVEIGREEIDRLERLVSGLRKMVMSHRLERRQVQVSELCDRVETLMRDRLGERRIERSIPVGAAVACDPDQVMQILVNLVANALEAAGDGAIGIRWNVQPGGAELLVWDTGAGFAEESAKLFVPGYTTRPRGTGLGLAITHRLVRAHGWGISALRHHGFTEFVVSIPRRDVVAALGGGAAAAGAA